MIGQELGGRYELIERIGGGGMALVYKAHDVILKRKVAIKVLRQQFVHDEDFIRRFRREAQSAASLSHPNVVSIYDVGQDGDIHYIVMEYIEGINLNEKIKELAPLQVEEAVHIASQICDALDHAHHNQIIHRDIKPHNILIGKNGRVKVTDFGIARAATNSDITQTGSVIGSVHYFSPEHAKGVSQGEKSDIYSLGIVLYQMLTGKLPFLGESPISVALKHLQEDVEEPRKVNPLIPQSVENIILKALRKKPEQRYQSAKQMLNDLETCLLPEKRNVPKVMFFDDDENDSEKTRVMPAIRPDQLASMVDNGRKDPAEPNKKRPWLKPLIWTFVTILLLALMWVGVSYAKNKLTVPEVNVPTVTDLSVKEAKAKLKKARLVADPIEYEFSDKYKKNIVMDQDKKDMRVKTGSSVKLIVSKGSEIQVMSDYVGMLWNDVQSEVQSKFNKTQIVIEEIYSDEEPGTIIKQEPAADEEYNPQNVTLTLTISKGKGTVEMPNLIGLKEDVAVSLLTKYNLKLAQNGIVRQPSYMPVGTVFKQFPYEPKDPAEPNSEITLYISSGYPDDAIEAVKNIEVAPAENGKKTTVKILISDARGENREWGVKEITEAQSYPVMVVLSKNTNAVITVYRNDKFWNAFTVTYSEAQSAQQPTETSNQSDTSTHQTDPAHPNQSVTP